MTIDRHLPKWLKHVRLWDGTKVPEELKARVLREFQRMQAANRQIRELEKERARRIRTADDDPCILKVRKLMNLCGIGVNSSWLYVREVFGWRKIRNRRQMGSTGGADADALQQWRSVAGTGDQPGRQPPHAVHVDRDRLGLAAVPAGKRTEPFGIIAVSAREASGSGESASWPWPKAAGGAMEIPGT